MRSNTRLTPLYPGNQNALAARIARFGERIVCLCLNYPDAAAHQRQLEANGQLLLWQSQDDEMKLARAKAIAFAAANGVKHSRRKAD